VSAPVVLNVPSDHSIDWWIGNTLDSGVRWAVPVFVMISGALNLDPSKNDRAVEFFRKRVSRVLVPLVFWSIVYSIINARENGFGPIAVLSALVRGEPSRHLWYLYMMIGLYLYTPFLKTYLKGAEKREITFLIGTLFALAICADTLQNLNFINYQSVFTQFVPYIGYYLCGYHLFHYYHDHTEGVFRVSLLTLILSTCLIAGGVGFLTIGLHLKNGFNYVYTNFSPPVMSASIAVFLMVCGKGRKWDEPVWFRKAINIISPKTLGIYIVHPVVLLISQKTLTLPFEKVSPVIGIPLLSGLVFLTSLVVVSFLMRTPMLRRVV
jgi:surface polysaccharide O-acyltransferase-like enzyme